MAKRTGIGAYLPFASIGALNGGFSIREYDPDGEPRVPKIGDIIKIDGRFTRVNFSMKTKWQIYK